ncbi:zinc finger protein 540-like isoform X2 [Plectropomus leopardus]|uniref:zinc finger protein 540-like isoform X2 n=1 Tax=Plectropomus leopardus TaxID=160734 RepID=UPI001C4B46DF|nr:zinc finger protein 540-like isoform X2 [Plectropomus leopardus]
MSDYLMRGFRAQLTTSMDSILRRAVFEIMMIFENSLHDHKLEMAQKGHEIAQLKIKLQRAELKLTESEQRGDQEAEMIEILMNETQKEPLDAPGQPSDVPEIDFEVPDDWCAPLGCETVTKPQNSACPSVRLRQLSIPLWPIPVKQEVVNCESNQQAKDLGKSSRGSSLKKKHKQTKDKTLPVDSQGTHRMRMRNDMKKLLQDIKQGYADLTGATGLRRKGKKSTGKEQENTTKLKRDEQKLEAAESTEKETVTDDDEKKYSCKFCNKVFNTEFGLSVHVRSHKRCRGCKRDFPFPSALKLHKSHCKKLKLLLEKEAESSNPPKPESSEEKPTAPSKKQVVVKESAKESAKESEPSSSNHSESSIQKAGPTKKHVCVRCNKSFVKRWALTQHFRVHTGERPFPCSMCPKRFRVNQARKKHILRVHKDQTQPSETTKTVARTKPSEETEDDQEKKKDRTRAVNHNNAQGDGSPDTKPSSAWETMGTACADGFMCLLCKKVTSSKYGLIEHYRIHTGEKPIKCDMCPAKFRFRGQLSMHKKRCLKTGLTQCAKCQEKFSSPIRCKRHMAHCNRDKPKLCKVCGKAFFTKGRLKTHMKTNHL